MNTETLEMLGGWAIMAFMVLFVIVALRDKKSRDAAGRIRTWSPAWWVIVAVVPFGWLWAVGRDSTKKEAPGD